MSTIKVIRKPNGELKTSQKGNYIFTKEGVYFSLNEEQLKEMNRLITGILDKSLISIDPNSEEMALGE